MIFSNKTEVLGIKIKQKRACQRNKKIPYSLEVKLMLAQVCLNSEEVFNQQDQTVGECPPMTIVRAAFP